MPFAPLTDPWFYAAAAPAVLLLGISKSGFGSGFGSLAVPMMALSISVPMAAAILMPVLALMDLLGIWAYRRDMDKALLRRLIPLALVGTLIGTLSFRWLDARSVAGLVGALTLVFLLQRRLFPPKKEGQPPPTWVGSLLTVTSGFTSFVAHAGGPPINAYMLPMRLSPVRFTATMAYLFFAINLSKWLPYAYLGLLDGRNFATSLVLLPLAPIGVWLGVRMARRINLAVFYRFIEMGMLLTGLKLLWDAWP